MPPKDEEIVSRTIEDLITRRGKGFIARLKNGRLTVDPDVLVQCLRTTSPTPQPNPQTNTLRASQEQNRDARGSAAESSSSNSGQSQSGPLQRNPSDLGHMQQSTELAPTTIRPIGITRLRSILRYGRISYRLEDLQIRDPEFIVPELINQSLFQAHQYTPEIGVRIVEGIDGKLRCSFDTKLIEVSRSRYEGIKIAANETLMLKTRIRAGRVSFQDEDIHFRHGNFEIPKGIIDKLKEENCATPCGDLYIISDEKQNLRSIVKIGNYNRLRTFLNKQGF